MFDTSSGRAWFINPCRRSAQKNSKVVSTQKYAKFKGLRKDTQLNGLIVRVISWIPRESKWKVADENAPGGNVKYYGVKDENLELIHWNLKSIDDIKIGDTIKIKSGQWGVVQYNGKHFGQMIKN